MAEKDDQKLRIGLELPAEDLQKLIDASKTSAGKGKSTVNVELELSAEDVSGLLEASEGRELTDEEVEEIVGRIERGSGVTGMEPAIWGKLASKFASKLSNKKIRTTVTYVVVDVVTDVVADVVSDAAVQKKRTGPKS